MRLIRHYAVIYYGALPSNLCSTNKEQKENNFDTPKLTSVPIKVLAGATAF